MKRMHDIMTNSFTKFYKKNKSTISLNKNLLLSGIVGFIVSLVIAYYSTRYSSDNFLISALTVIIGFISSKLVFAILFHLDQSAVESLRNKSKIRQIRNI
jgi:uncharacterized membrane protein